MKEINIIGARDDATTPVTLPHKLQITREGGMMGSDFKTQVECGLVKGWSIMSALGERESLAAPAAGEDISRMNDLSRELPPIVAKIR